ncbi:SUF system NifU family Fe-S cluster assembly protein [bacterium]|nr:SUF system NifU family Fe-S cluster assembly protein [Chloroflexi bacterium CFX6]RIL09609.1 MAG: SUF system NifU family Fe-S cluster assembly protein [bacterium]
MSDLLDLYQEIILDHSRHPRNFRGLPDANRVAEGYNPLCGDRVTLRLRVEHGTIEDIAFEGAGCAISTASASVLTEVLKGRPVAEVEPLIRRMLGIVTGEAAGGPSGASAGSADVALGDPGSIDDLDPELGALDAFSGVREYPSRVKCATLAWHALRAALARPAGA